MQKYVFFSCYGKDLGVNMQFCFLKTVILTRKRLCSFLSIPSIKTIVCYGLIWRNCGCTFAA